MNEPEHLWLFVEGLPGSGKSSTSTRLVRRLESEGVACRLIHEGVEDPAVGLPWSYVTARETVRLTTPSTYPYAGWREPPAETQVSVVDARFLQCTALFAMLRDEPGEDLAAIPRTILANLCGDARLISLRQSDPRAHLRSCLASRKQPHAEWHRFVLEFFSEQPWCRDRKLSGVDAFVEALAAWDQVSHEIQGSLDLPLSVYSDPQVHWERALSTILDHAVKACVSRL